MLKFALYCEIKLQTKQLEFIQYVGVLIHWPVPFILSESKEE